MGLPLDFLAQIETKVLLVQTAPEIYAGQHASAPSKSPVEQDSSVASDTPKPALDPEKWVSFKVVNKEELTPNTYRLRSAKVCYANGVHAS